MHCAVDQCSEVSGKHTALVSRVTVYVYDEVVGKKRLLSVVWESCRQSSQPEQCEEDENIRAGTEQKPLVLWDTSIVP